MTLLAKNDNFLQEDFVKLQVGFVKLQVPSRLHKALRAFASHSM